MLSYNGLNGVVGFSRNLGSESEQNSLTRHSTKTESTAVQSIRCDLTRRIRSRQPMQLIVRHAVRFLKCILPYAGPFIVNFWPGMWSPQISSALLCPKYPRPQLEVAHVRKPLKSPPPFPRVARCLIHHKLIATMPWNNRIKIASCTVYRGGLHDLPYRPGTRKKINNAIRWRVTMFSNCEASTNLGMAKRTTSLASQTHYSYAGGARRGKLFLRLAPPINVRVR